jgi:hypothetical protein
MLLTMPVLAANAADDCPTGGADEAIPTGMVGLTPSLSFDLLIIASVMSAAGAAGSASTQPGTLALLQLLA